MREVRFSAPPAPVASLDFGEVTNSFGGWPTSEGLWPYLVLRVFIQGEVDESTGFVCNIQEIDRAVRTRVAPMACNLIDSQVTAESLLRESWSTLKTEWRTGIRMYALELSVTPHLRYMRTEKDPNMVYLTQSFEFSASHRLYASSLSDEDNQRTFGKCCNPSGHGHNYVLDVTIKGVADGDERFVGVADFERIVQEEVIRRFDHKHLDVDCEEFKELNSTVENIARVIWSLLHGRVDQAELHSIKVWETPKTYAEYLGEN
jgi:6-pyruvoyltetrahydropterin/6-carboxytetrahydropterin synthase